jgi:putative peptidoglycan lipid II flippase
LTTPPLEPLPPPEGAAAGGPGRRAGARTGRAASLVAAGILLSRIAGVIRQAVFALFFGTTPAGDAFNAAFRIPNLLQNLLGEGVLSASFIPEYAGLRARGRDSEAARLAAAVGGLLAIASSLIVLAGVLAAPLLVDLIAGGFPPETRALTVTLVRILFPGAALLVFSAWCLAILNSHGKFFLSYVAPVIWNAAMIATLLWFGGLVTQSRLAELLAWGSVVGSALQFTIQLPWVTGYLRSGGWRGGAPADALRRVIRNFIPVVIGRGVVQISAYIDTRIASLVTVGAVSAVMYAQMLYLLPISLFAMSVSAAELPAMASEVGEDEAVHTAIRDRVSAGLRRIAFFVIPSMVALIALGDVIAAALYQRGEFDVGDTIWVWQILAAASVGLLAVTFGRLYSSAFYALRDTRTPLKFALLRITLSAALGYTLAVLVPPALGIDIRIGAAGLTLAGSVAGWLEYVLLRRALAQRIGRPTVGGGYITRLLIVALVAVVAAAIVKLVFIDLHPVALALVVLPLYGLVYIGGTLAARVPEARRFIRGRG